MNSGLGLEYHIRKGDKSISKMEVEYIQNTGKESELPTVESYDPVRPQLLRNSSQCTCKICQVAKSSFNS